MTIDSPEDFHEKLAKLKEMDDEVGTYRSESSISLSGGLHDCFVN